MSVVVESSALLDTLGSTSESLKDCADVSSLLHGDDSQLVLLVDPNEESLLLVVEDSTTLRPVSVQATGFEETITLLEEEVIRDELILDFL